MPVAFLFDNDGVLTDTSEFHWRAWEMLMEREPALKIDKNAFQATFGMRNDLILQKVAPHVSKETHIEWTHQKEHIFREIARGEVTLLPGMEHFLKQVAEAKIPHIIASSTPTANLELLVSSTALGKYFTEYLSAENVAHGKPAPDIFIAAANHLGFKPDSCVVFEDAPAGLQAAKAAGCFAVALATTHHPNQLSLYDLIYPSARELDLQEILNAFNLWST